MKINNNNDQNNKYSTYFINIHLHLHFLSLKSTIIQPGFLHAMMYEYVISSMYVMYCIRSKA